jgi:thioredoxin reductase (NADPH)
MEALTGKGVYYGAALVEAISCKNEEVFLVGGANSAGQAAMHFAKYARKVTMLVRADSLEQSMSKYLIDQIAGTSNIAVNTRTVVTEAIGEHHLEALRVVGPEGEIVRKAQSFFIFIGAEPKTAWLPPSILRDEHGYVLAGPELKPHGWKQKREPYLLETSLPGVFVVGDVRKGSVKRVASAVGEGSIAVQFVHRYLSSV